MGHDCFRIQIDKRVALALLYQWILPIPAPCGGTTLVTMDSEAPVCCLSSPYSCCLIKITCSENKIRIADNQLTTQGDHFWPILLPLRRGPLVCCRHFIAGTKPINKTSAQINDQYDAIILLPIDALVFQDAELRDSLVWVGVKVNLTTHVFPFNMFPFNNQFARSVKGLTHNTFRWRMDP